MIKPRFLFCSLQKVVFVFCFFQKSSIERPTHGSCDLVICLNGNFFVYLLNQGRRALHGFSIGLTIRLPPAKFFSRSRSRHFPLSNAPPKGRHLNRYCTMSGRILIRESIKKDASADMRARIVVIFFVPIYLFDLNRKNTSGHPKPALIHSLPRWSRVGQTKF